MRSISLRTKFLIGTVGLVILLGLAVIIFVQTTLTQKLEAELQDKGIFIAKHMADMSVNNVLSENTLAIQMLVNDYKNSDEDIEYIFVLNSQGEVSAHTFEKGFPIDLKKANIPSSGQAYKILPLVTEKGAILDIAVPLFKGEVGIVHVGISEEPIRKDIANIIRLIVGIIIAVLILGGGLSVVFAKVITKPIFELTEVAKIVGGGDLERKICIRTKDEIGQLGAAFNEMIVKRKQAEQKIKDSLKEKEVLIQEIHHRVKNNLQVMSSLLNLQSKNVRDKQAAQMLKESQNRIKSMALIHEKLYQSKDLAKIDFKEYIKDLTYKLFRSYETDPGKIALNMDLEDISLGVDTAIPFGLIINELVSNCLKHAFPQNREGEIKVALHSIDKNEIELTVSDNGVGLPDDFDFKKKKSLGLHLVNILTEDQLDGKIELNKTEGTEFKIRFQRGK